ncbi:MAG: asparagine synthase-related protein [Thermoplasmata archaeon]
MEQDSEAWKLACLMRSVVGELAEERRKIALMFSGGLDSTILAVIARKHCDLVLYTLGLEDSHDLRWGRECASIMDLDLVSIVPEKDDVIRSIGNVTKVHGMDNPQWLSTFVAFDIVLENVPDKAIMCGQGADELFGGYRKYAASGDPVPMMVNDTSELLELELPAYRRMANNHGKELLAPYLDTRVVSFAQSIPIGLKISASENKIVLRDAAGLLGVPLMMARKQKKAMQYGSGISKLIRQHLKKPDSNI